MSFTENVSQRNDFPIYRYGLQQGLIAGVVMLIYRLVLRLAGVNGNVALDMLTFLFLGPIIGISIYNYRKVSEKFVFFRNSIRLGLFIGFVAGIILVGFMALLYMADFQLVSDTQKYFYQAENVGQLLMIDVIWLFQTVVFGMIWTFIFLQFFKKDLK